MPESGLDDQTIDMSTSGIPRQAGDREYSSPVPDTTAAAAHRRSTTDPPLADDSHAPSPSHVPPISPPASPPTVVSPRRNPPHNTFADPTLMAGRSLGIWVYVLALVLAALADFGNFFQIIQFAIPSQNDRILLVIVIGFTACVLFLAHVAGVMLRVLKAGETWIPKAFPWLALAVWLALGGCGLYLRLIWQQVASGPNDVDVIGQPTASATLAPDPTALALPSHDSVPNTFPVLGAAFIFLGLYLATGLVAMIGGYLTHNPARSAFAKAKKQYDRAVGEAAESARSYAAAAGEMELHELRKTNADLMRVAEQVELVYLASELKQRTRTAIAERTQDAALTDAYFPEADDE